MPKKLIPEIRELLTPFITDEIKEAIKFHEKNKGRSDSMLDGPVLKARMDFYKLSEDRLSRLLKIAREAGMTEEKTDSAVSENIQKALADAARLRNEAYDLMHPPETDGEEK